MARPAARAMGVATERDLRDYFRMPVADAKARIDEIELLSDRRGQRLWLPPSTDIECIQRAPRLEGEPVSRHAGDAMHMPEDLRQRDGARVRRPRPDRESPVMGARTKGINLSGLDFDDDTLVADISRLARAKRKIRRTVSAWTGRPCGPGSASSSSVAVLSPVLTLTTTAPFLPTLPLMLTLAVPRFFGGIDKSKEVVLAELKRRRGASNVAPASVRTSRCVYDTPQEGAAAVAVAGLVLLSRTNDTRASPRSKAGFWR